MGLNCGRWDYIFSFIKKFSKREDFVLPDRAAVTMTTHFLRSYSLLLIKTCHRRGAFAMGGMSAYIPVKNDEAANEKAFAMVRADKEREAGDGHDGTWVAHPGLVPVAMEVFDRMMKGPNQVERQRDDGGHMQAKDLLAWPFPKARSPKCWPFAQQHQRVGAIPGVMAERCRVCADFQPDGRCRYR